MESKMRNEQNSMDEIYELLQVSDNKKLIEIISEKIKDLNMPNSHLAKILGIDLERKPEYVI